MDMKNIKDEKTCTWQKKEEEHEIDTACTDNESNGNVTRNDNA